MPIDPELLRLAVHRLQKKYQKKQGFIPATAGQAQPAGQPGGMSPGMPSAGMDPSLLGLMGGSMGGVSPAGPTTTVGDMGFSAGMMPGTGVGDATSMTGSSTTGSEQAVPASSPSTSTNNEDQIVQKVLEKLKGQSSEAAAQTKKKSGDDLQRKIEIVSSDVYQIKQIVLAMANAMGLQLPASAFDGVPRGERGEILNPSTTSEHTESKEISSNVEKKPPSDNNTKLGAAFGRNLSNALNENELLGKVNVVSKAAKLAKLLQR